MPTTQIPLALGIAPVQRFETFFAGPNAESVATARAFAEGVLKARSLVVHGPPGCGKTHILNAAAHALAARGLRVHAIDLVQNFDEGYTIPDGFDVILADGAHASLPPPVEGALFNWYNTHAAVDGNNGGKVIVALRPPLAGSEIRDDLRTRLAAGLVVRLAALDDTELKLALAHHARARGLELNDGVLQYLVTRLTRDMSTLTALLDGLDTLSLAEKRAISIPLLRTLIS
jgi:DnaA-homolog protein